MTRRASLTLRGSGEERCFYVDQTEGQGSLRLANVALSPESKVTLELSNAGTEGYVAADGVQLLPVK